MDSLGSHTIHRDCPIQMDCPSHTAHSIPTGPKTHKAIPIRRKVNPIRNKTIPIRHKENPNRSKAIPNRCRENPRRKETRQNSPTVDSSPTRASRGRPMPNKDYKNSTRTGWYVGNSKWGRCSTRLGLRRCRWCKPLCHIRRNRNPWSNTAQNPHLYRNACVRASEMRIGFRLWGSPYARRFRGRNRFRRTPSRCFRRKR